ncbi:hypothetical protein UY3_16756 [Chelonia mydas]|uniref:Uncharacterized protein n=1 Tax=Chelonia mydas TaxID=8469 RepID=M7ATB1_CHEMY|nr:hypothetical protein UY3_16756 [Chelonia mydas]
MPAPCAGPEHPLTPLQQTVGGGRESSTTIRIRRRPVRSLEEGTLSKPSSNATDVHSGPAMTPDDLSSKAEAQMSQGSARWREELWLGVTSGLVFHRESGAWLPQGPFEKTSGNGLMPELLQALCIAQQWVLALPHGLCPSRPLSSRPPVESVNPMGGLPEISYKHQEEKQSPLAAEKGWLLTELCNFCCESGQTPGEDLIPLVQFTAGNAGEATAQGPVEISSLESHLEIHSPPGD